jgi:uncharacterized protein (TIGR03067 family)
MDLKTLFGLVFALALAGCSGAPSAPTLSGRWAPESAELGGQPFPIANFGGAVLQLTMDGYEFANDRGTYVVLTRRPPAQMDIRGQQGPNAGRTIPAIFDLAADKLTICYQLGAGARPADFASPAGTQILLIHYKRVK